MPVTVQQLDRLVTQLSVSVGKLTGALQWCIEHSGETLDDNPKQLAIIKKYLAEAKDSIDV